MALVAFSYASVNFEDVTAGPSAAFDLIGHRSACLHVIVIRAKYHGYKDKANNYPKAKWKIGLLNEYNIFSVLKCGRVSRKNACECTACEVNILIKFSQSDSLMELDTVFLSFLHKIIIMVVYLV